MIVILSNLSAIANLSLALQALVLNVMRATYKVRVHRDKIKRKSLHRTPSLSSEMQT